MRLAALVLASLAWGCLARPTDRACALAALVTQDCEARRVLLEHEAASEEDRGGGGSWRQGVATYYTSREGGPFGAGGARLSAFRSVAVPIEDFKRREQREVEIRNLGTFVVEDGCAGHGCKDFDIFVGDDADDARRIPNWEEGNIPIEYKWL